MHFATKAFGLVLTSVIGWIQAPPVLAQEETKLICHGSGMHQGSSVAISADAKTILVGAPVLQGGVCVWSLKGVEWVEQPEFLVGKDSISSSLLFEKQGDSLAVSADGNTAIVGDLKGSAWVWTRNHDTWSQQGLRLWDKGLLDWVKAQNVEFVKSSVGISADGNTAIVGYGEAASVWVWTRTSETWSLQAKLAYPGGNGITNAKGCGESVALSADGNTASAGCLGTVDSGEVRVWTRNRDVWSQQGPPLVGSGAIGKALQGSSVALSADGNELLAGGPRDNHDIGAVWVWTRTAGVWSQQGRKLVATRSGTSFQGISVALSGDGNIALVGGPTNASSTGAAWAWARNGLLWTEFSKLQGTKAFTDHVSAQGKSVALSRDGRIAVVGGPNDGADDDGAVWVYKIAAPRVPTAAAEGANKH
jgi:hypothetical protein